MKELVTAILGSGVLTALMSFLGARLARRDTLKDRAAEEATEREGIQKRLSLLEESRRTLQQSTEALMKAQRSLLRDRVVRLARECLKNGFLTPPDMETLWDLYEQYKALGGNGSAAALMDRVRKLPVKQKYKE